MAHLYSSNVKKNLTNPIELYLHTKCNRNDKFFQEYDGLQLRYCTIVNASYTFILITFKTLVGNFE